MTVTVRRWDDPTSWNRFVSSVPRAHFQQSWEWGELAPDLGGQAVRLAALRDGNLAGAMQVFISPVHHVNRTYLYVPRGPALASPTVDILGPLLDQARLLGREQGALGLKMEPNTPVSNSSFSRLLAQFSLKPTYPASQPRSSWMLDIQPGEDTLLAGMKQKTRYNVRLAARKGVVVRSGDARDLDTFYTIYRETAERDGFFIHGQALYRRMFDLFGAAGNFSMLLAECESEVVAAVTLIRLGTTCWYMHGASSNRHRNLMATYLLQWEAIRRAKAWGCTLYDFRAVPDVLREGEDMYGVYRFKEGFGGYQDTTLPTYAASYRPGSFALWQLYFSGRFRFDCWRRSRRGLPRRQFA